MLPASAALVAAILTSIVSQDIPRSREPVPGDARVILTTDKPAFLLGENVLVHYCLENTGDAPLTISVGGDYSGGTRNDRFKVDVTDEQGHVMPDPAGGDFNMGGLGATPSLAKGERWCQSLPLMRYARIDRPGTYRVRVTHDLGWPKGRAPSGEMTMQLAQPTPDEAAAVVTAMKSLPQPENVMGRLSRPYADYTTLRYAVYLPLLSARAQKGDTEVLSGIAAMSSPDATRALIGFLSSQDPAIARAAAQYLAMRLPDPALTGALGPRSPFADGSSSPRSYLRDMSWRPEFAAEVRTAGKTLLNKSDIRDVVEGAFFLEAVGEPDDGPALSGALTREIERAVTLLFEKGGYPRPRGALAELMRAADVLVARGYVIATPSDVPGDVVLWLVNVGRGARPPGWEEMMGRALADSHAYVREVALDKLPDASAARFASAIGASLDAANLDERIAACKVVGRAKLAVFQPKVTAIVEQAADFGLVQASQSALSQLAGRVSVLHAQAVRLALPSTATDTLAGLLGIFDATGWQSNDQTAGADAAALSRRWLAFIEAHRAELDAGQRLSLDRADIPTDLVPAGWILNRPGKPGWPPR